MIFLEPQTCLVIESCGSSIDPGSCSWYSIIVAIITDFVVEYKSQLTDCQKAWTHLSKNKSPEEKGYLHLLYITFPIYKMSILTSSCLRLV
jgi:hypothetical protein